VRDRAVWIGACLAFIAGFADASTFVGAGGIFCAHVTGNFVVLAADLARRAHADEWLKLATFPLFVASVLVATQLHRRRLGPPPVSSTRMLLACKTALFGAAAAIGALAPASADDTTRVAIVALLVVAMGIQNAMHRLTPALGPMTTVMTGNVSQWLVEKLLPGAPEAAPKHRALGIVIVAFAIGCASGAVGVAQLGFGVLAVPMAIAWFARSRVAPG